MPKNTTVAQATDLDYDLASLVDPLTDDALEMLSTVLDSRDILDELAAYNRQAQTMLEAGRTPFEIRELLGVDLDDLTEKLRAATVWMVG